MVVLVLLCDTGQAMCPTLSAQLGQPQDLDLTSFSASVQFVDFTSGADNQSEVFLIQNGTVISSFRSMDSTLANMASTFPVDLRSISVQFDLGGANDSMDTSELSYTISVSSLDESIAPAACLPPQPGDIAPGINQTLDIGFSCKTEGRVVQQVCLTVGTEPFDLLDGTYHTFLFFFPLVCSESSALQCELYTPPKLIAEMCMSLNMSQELVQFGAGSWSFLTNVFLEGDREGFCFIDERAIPEPGIVMLIRDDSINIQYAIPSSFNYLDVHLVPAPSLDPLLPISYSILPTAVNKTVLDDPVPLNDVPLQGVLYDRRAEFLFDLRCKEAGLSQVFVYVNVSTVMNGIIYMESYPDLYFYRNCTRDLNDTIVLVGNSTLGVEIGVPLAVVFLVLVGVAVLLVFFTQRHRKKIYRLEQEHQLSLLASTNNAYFLSNFDNQFTSLRESCPEYNFASLEFMGKLGEGAFGQVFKARAPGLQAGTDNDEDTEFVAVKVLKEDAGSDVLTSFLAEVKTSVQFRHANVIQLISICTHSQRKCMIFEYMDLGSLNDLLRKSDPNNPAHSADDPALIPPAKFLWCCLQVAQGLSYLSSLKFVHRDIATRNCLIDSHHVVKIADFGLSREISNDYYRIGSATACLPVRWMPPEALLYGKFTVKSDVWSYGVLMWEVYSFACQPFGGISNYEVIDRIKNGQMLGCPDLCPASIFDVMRTCWAKAPQRRPAMAVIVQKVAHLFRSNSMSLLDDYTTMGAAEGYLNLAFGTEVQPEELEEKRRVENAIKEKESCDNGHQTPEDGPAGDESEPGSSKREAEDLRNGEEVVLDNAR